MDADRPLAGRTMDQLYDMAGPEMGQEQRGFAPQVRAEVSYPCMDRRFCKKISGSKTS